MSRRPNSENGPPRIGIRDPQPCLIGNPAGRKFAFDNLDPTKQNTARIPQDLSAFVAAGTITDETLRDVNTTTPPITDLADGVANIGFLRGDGVVVNRINTFGSPNADAVQIDAQFWIETVETVVHIPALKAGQQPARLVPDKGPLFIVQPPASGEAPARDTKITFTQIQYSQPVLLNFGGLSWQHVSVATLVPQEVRL